MSCLSAAVLGIVQGLGELLPISSSAHLVLIPWLFGWQYQGQTYDVALHWGTLVAVCAYFRRDWIGLIKAGFSRQESPERRLFWSIVLATIPGGLAGLLLDKHMEQLFHSPVRIALNLTAFAALLLWADRKGRKSDDLKSLGPGSCLLIGIQTS